MKIYSHILTGIALLILVGVEINTVRAMEADDVQMPMPVDDTSKKKEHTQKKKGKKKKEVPPIFTSVQDSTPGRTPIPRYPVFSLRESIPTTPLYQGNCTSSIPFVPIRPATEGQAIKTIYELDNKEWIGKIGAESFFADDPSRIETAQKERNDTEEDTFISPAALIRPPAKSVDIQELNRNLFSAVASNNEQQVTMLIAKGAQVNARDDSTLRTPLHCAAARWRFNESFRSQLAIINALINAGADVNAKALNNETPLHATFDIDIAKVLVGAGASVNAQTSDGRSGSRLFSLLEVIQSERNLSS